MDPIKPRHLCGFGRNCRKETCPLFHPRWANDPINCVFCIKKIQEKDCWEPKHAGKKRTLADVIEWSDYRTDLWYDVFTSDYYSPPKPEPEPVANPIETVSVRTTKKQKRPIEMWRFSDGFVDQESDSECMHNQTEVSGATDSHT